MLDIRWLKGVYWVKHCIQLQLSDMECLVTMVANKHNTEILLCVDPKGSSKPLTKGPLCTVNSLLVTLVVSAIASCSLCGVAMI